jgi:hypothetical protein
MSLRLIAKDLYRLQRTVDRLKKEVDRCPPGKSEKLKRQLAKAIADKNQMKRLLDGRLDR